jgi:TolA-binding protein
MNNIVPADEDCLSQDQLSRYVQEDCNLEEMRWIDRHLLNCPMCSDAVEGVMLSDMIDFQLVMSRVEAKIDDKVNTTWTPKMDTPIVSIAPPKRFTIGQRGLKWAAAAGLTGVIALGVWQNSTQNAPKAESKMAVLAESPAVPTTVDMAAPAAPAAMPQVAAPVTAPKQAKNAPLPATTTQNVYADAPLKKPEERVPVPTEKVQTTDVVIGLPNKNKEESLIADNSTKQSAADEINDAKISETRVEVKAEAARVKDVSTAKTAPSSVATAPSAPIYESEDGYAGAANQRVQGMAPPAKKSKKRSNNNVSDLYQNAYNAYNQKSYKMAIAGFNQVLAEQPLDKNEIYENTLWYLSDAYLQTGDKVKAKALLERIIAEKLQNQQKAVQKLKSWN